LIAVVIVIRSKRFLHREGTWAEKMVFDFWVLKGRGFSRAVSARKLTGFSR
jgi:hypothetical protein